MGRPTIFRPDMVGIAADYLVNYTDHEDAIPSFEGLAHILDTTPQTIYRWLNQGQTLTDSLQDDDGNDLEGCEEKYQEFQELEQAKIDFCYTLQKLMPAQKRRLVNGGLTNELNSNIVKLALGNHGLSDKTQQEISGPGGGAQEMKHTGEVTFVGKGE